MSVQAWLEQRWYGGVAVALWLRGMARLFGLLGALRRVAFRRGWLRSTRLPVPVLVVGNISVGGVGKTPLVIALCEALRECGWKPGVISRGYGRRVREPRRVRPDSSADEVGDEPRLIARLTGCPVAVAARRVEAGRMLIEDGVDLLIADDGLQHYALQRDVEIAVIDGQRGLGNGRLLPAGPLREPPARLSQCDFVISNGTLAADWAMPCESMQLQPDRCWRLCDGAAAALADFRDRPLHALAGIGHPERFFASLRAAGMQAEEHPFPDHHRFSRDDLCFAHGAVLLMTEKDAMKVADWAEPGWYAVGVNAVLSERFLDALSQRLRAAQGALR